MCKRNSPPENEVSTGCLGCGREMACLGEAP